jgi:hypothetical protein
MQIIKVNNWNGIPRNYTGITEYPNGTKEWWLNGEQHREDGPAVEGVNGYKVWYLYGELHRVGGPAKEFADGSKFWYLNGERHREDGPAIERANGYKAWWLNDEQINFASDKTLSNINQLLDTIEGEPNVDVETFEKVESDRVIFISKIIVSSGGYGFKLTIDSQEEVFVDGERIISPPLTEDTIDELVSIIMKRGQETTHKRFEKQAEDPFMKESFSLAKILFDN